VPAASYHLADQCQMESPGPAPQPGKRALPSGEEYGFTYTSLTKANLFPLSEEKKRKDRLTEREVSTRNGMQMMKLRKVSYNNQKRNGNRKSSTSPERRSPRGTMKSACAQPGRGHRFIQIVPNWGATPKKNQRVAKKDSSSIFTQRGKRKGRTRERQQKGPKSPELEAFIHFTEENVRLRGSFLS